MGTEEEECRRARRPPRGLGDGGGTERGETRWRRRGGQEEEENKPRGKTKGKVTAWKRELKG